MRSKFVTFLLKYRNFIAIKDEIWLTLSNLRLNMGSSIKSKGRRSVFKSLAKK
jgi:hypothetical protein